jgi:hypothetical protein
MLGRDDQGELILQNLGGLELGVARHKGDGTEVQAIIEHFMRNIAGEHAVDTHLHAGMLFAKLTQSGEEGVNGALIHSKREFATLESLKLGEAFLDLIAEIDEAFGVVFQEGPRIGEADGPRATDKKRLPERVFKLADRQADGGLGAVKTLSRAREAAFLGNHQKYLKFTQIHGSPSEPV